MISIRYSLLGKSANDNKHEIVARINISSQNRPTLRTGILVRREYFKTAQTNGHGHIRDIVIPRQTAFNKNEIADAKDAKKRLDIWSRRVVKICEILLVESNDIDKKLLTDAIELCKDISIEEITNAILLPPSRSKQWPKEKSSKNIYQLAAEYIQAKQFSESHAKSFKVLIRALNRFELYIQAKKDSNFVLDVETLTEDNVNDFYLYIQKEHILAKKDESLFKELLKSAPIEITPKHQSPQITQRGGNTIIKYKKRLAGFFKWLNKNHITSNNPTLNIDIGAEKFGKPIYLTTEERDKIATFDFGNNHRLATQRDIFIFQCYTGCRVGDLMKLTKKNVVGGYLNYVPHKTKDKSDAQDARVPLLSIALELINKYDNIDTDGRLFPFISTQKYNNAIKQILTECGITRIVSIRDSITGEFEQKRLNEIAASHIARKTFINSEYKEVKDPNIVGRMSGHVEGSKAFARYREIDDDILFETISKIAPKNDT